MQEAPYKGLKVVELARVLAGPWVGQTLADLGAQVIKVEAPAGDDTRQWGPPFMERPLVGGGSETVAVYFHAANRGKTSVVCDFANPDDIARLNRLIDDADVVVENFKVGGLKKFGLDYDTLAKRNPRLIYASITGFGQTGPRAKQPGYDGLIQGLCGIMDLTGEPDGEPQKVGVAWIDIFTGLYAVIAIQAALAEREKSGLGQWVDLALLDTGVAVLANQSMNYLLGGVMPRRSGNVHPNIFPYQLFGTRSGHVFLACGNDSQFRALCKALNLDGLCDDPRFARNADRLANKDVLLPILESAFGTRDRPEVIAAVEKAGVPIGPINTVAEAMADPQVLARDMEIAPEGVRGLRTPIRFSRSTLDHSRAAPTLGNGVWHFETKRER